jgi:hypothetical protein
MGGGTRDLRGNVICVVRKFKYIGESIQESANLTGKMLPPNEILCIDREYRRSSFRRSKREKEHV